jgi:hypothetical protein
MTNGCRVEHSGGGRKYITVLGHCDPAQEPWGRGQGPKTWVSCDSGLVRMRNENTSKRAMFHDRVLVQAVSTEHQGSSFQAAHHLVKKEEK